MSSDELVRAWKDPDLRAAIGVDHPAGDVEMTDVTGGTIDIIIDVISEYLGTCWGVSCGGNICY